MKKEEKKKATSKWLPRSVFLLRLLSAELGWETYGLPDILEQDATKLLKMKIFQATLFLRDNALEDNWPGGMLKSGLSNFLTF